MQKAQRSNKKTQKPMKASTKRNFTTAKKTAKKIAPVRKTSKRNLHVAVIGAAGGIGQPLSMLIKQNQNNIFTQLSVYDVNPVVTGVAADLSHIPTSVKVQGFTDLDAALKGADIVVVPAGVPRKPGMTRDDLFNTNAKINFTVASAVAKNCPDASSLIISNPVNSMVPLWAEVFKAKGVYNPSKLFGVTTLDLFRATTFSYDKTTFESPLQTAIPVIGGHAGTTIVPLFSTAPGLKDLSNQDLEALVKRTMFGGDEVVQAKAGAGSATLSMAAAGARFAESIGQAIKHPSVDSGKLIKLLNNKSKTSVEQRLEDAAITGLEYAFVDNPLAKEAFGCEFFSSGVVLTPNGVGAIHPTWELGSVAEKKLVADMAGDLKSQIEKGQAWAKNELAGGAAATKA